MGYVVYTKITSLQLPLHWRYNDHDGVSNHQPHGCLLNLLFRRWSKKTSKLPVTGLCVGNSPGPVNSPHKGPVTRKMFPFDDVIMSPQNITEVYSEVMKRNAVYSDHNAYCNVFLDCIPSFSQIHCSIRFKFITMWLLLATQGVIRLIECNPGWPLINQMWTLGAILINYVYVKDSGC